MTGTVRVVSTYLNVRKTIRNAEGEVVLTFDDVVIRGSRAWGHLLEGDVWTTATPGHGLSYTVTYERTGS